LASRRTVGSARWRCDDERQSRIYRTARARHPSTIRAAAKQSSAYHTLGHADHLPPPGEELGSRSGQIASASGLSRGRKQYPPKVSQGRALAAEGVGSGKTTTSEQSRTPHWHCTTPLRQTEQFVGRGATGGAENAPAGGAPADWRKRAAFCHRRAASALAAACICINVAIFPLCSASRGQHALRPHIRAGLGTDGPAVDVGIALEARSIHGSATPSSRTRCSTKANPAGRRVDRHYIVKSDDQPQKIARLAHKQSFSTASTLS
jgi:hypothetical protein